MAESSPNSKAFARLWVVAQPVVASYILSTVRNVADTDDLIQDVAEASLDDFGQFDQSKSFTAWVLGIARHRILNHFRTQRSRQHVMGGKTLALLAETHLEVSHREEDHQLALRECMRTLADKQEQLLRLRYYDDLAPSAIARQTNTSTRSVVNALYHIRRKLADCIAHRLSGGAEASRG